MNIKKFLFTSLIGFSGAAVPIASTVSCGTHSYDLTVGIRPEDQPLWEEVAKQFTKATGKSVGLRWVSDQNGEYSKWAGSGMMPDVAIADSNWARTGQEKGWFQQIDIPKIAKDPSLKISGQDSKYAEKDITFDGNNFETAMLNTMKANGDLYNGLAVIYGPKMTYAWKKLPKQAGGFLDLYDGTQNLKYYVPKRDGIIEEVTSFESNKESPLYSKKNDKHRLKNTVEDVQEFLSNAIHQDDLKFNTNDINGDLTNPESRVLSTGNTGYNQRLASVSKIIYDHIKDQNVQLKSTSATTNNLLVGSANEASIPFSIFAYGGALNKKTETKVEEATLNIDSNNVLDENKVLSRGQDDYKWDFATKTNNTVNSELSRRIYYGVLGYFHKGIFGTSDVFGQDDQQLSFAKFKSLFLTDGALWMWDGIKDKVENIFPGHKADELLTSFGSPIQETGVDGYAIRSGMKGEKLTLAKKFVRFLMQKQVAADITGTKAISTVKAAQKLQASLTGARKSGLDSIGTKPLDVSKIIGQNQIPFTIATNSKATGNLNGKDNAPVFSPYVEYWIKGKEYAPSKVDYSSNKGASYKTMTDAMNVYNTKYMDSLVV